MRAAAKIRKLNKVHQQDIEDQKKGLVYQAEIALNDAKKSQTKIERSEKKPTWHRSMQLSLQILSPIVLHQARTQIRKS